MLPLDRSRIFTLEYIQFLLLLSVFLARDRQWTALTVKLRAETVVVSALDAFDFPDDTAPRRLAQLILLVHPEALLFELMEVFEFSLPFPDNQELLGIRLNREGVLPILLQVLVLVLRETQSGKLTRGVAYLWASDQATLWPCSI